MRLNESQKSGVRILILGHNLLCPTVSLDLRFSLKFNSFLESNYTQVTLVKLTLVSSADQHPIIKTGIVHFASCWIVAVEL